MNYILLVLGVFGQLFMMVTYALSAMDKKIKAGERIQYILFASVCCAMVVALMIGLLKFNLLTGKK
ncbi:hypothetical protein WBJ53_16720 [Spirosoma sp. SC4-14]|uniref:hypothetical protein n=1 Tax=Spirosoma sp. SC4-14 TaxID=3128900 RepID=UPI0030CDA43B